jgi:hypothetical protein
MAAPPGKALGYGNNSTAQYVFAIRFTVDGLSSTPYLEAWDNSLTFPNRDLQGATYANDIFDQGAGGLPMLSAVATTDGAPASAWMPAAVTAGGATINRLKYFNMVCSIPSTATPAMTYDHLMQCRYTYTGAAPTVTWYWNDDAAGTETDIDTSPGWSPITPGSHGFRHGSSTSAAPDYYADIPYSSNTETVRGWVTE